MEFRYNLTIASQTCNAKLPTGCYFKLCASYALWRSAKVFFPMMICRGLFPYDDLPRSFSLWRSAKVFFPMMICVRLINAKLTTGYCTWVNQLQFAVKTLVFIRLLVLCYIIYYNRLLNTRRLVILLYYMDLWTYWTYSCVLFSNDGLRSTVA